MKIEILKLKCMTPSRVSNTPNHVELINHDQDHQTEPQPLVTPQGQIIKTGIKMSTLGSPALTIDGR